jgi:hypothetical protein
LGFEESLGSFLGLDEVIGLECFLRVFLLVLFESGVGLVALLTADTTAFFQPYLDMNIHVVRSIGICKIKCKNVN